jgi:hypothetical protein
MRVMIWVDMEGIAGIEVWDQATLCTDGENDFGPDPLAQGVGVALGPRGYRARRSSKYVD